MVQWMGLAPPQSQGGLGTHGVIKCRESLQAQICSQGANTVFEDKLVPFYTLMVLMGDLN